MEQEVRSHYHTRAAAGGGSGLIQNSNATASSASQRQNTERNLLLQWGNRKRLRCLRKENTATNNKQVGNSDEAPLQPATRIDPEPAAHQRVIRTDLQNSLEYHIMTDDHRESAAAPSPAAATALPQLQAYSRRTRQQSRYIRNSEAAAAAKASACSPEGSGVKGAAANGGGCSEEKKSAGAGSSSGSEGAAVWPPKFTIALTNQEKEEDFLVLKGSRLPQRPKKRAKLIQRTLNLVCPGGWLCDLTLDRYEVQEKKVSKKRARGLKALGNLESDSA